MLVAAIANCTHRGYSSSVSAWGPLYRESGAHSGALQTSLRAAAFQAGKVLLGHGLVFLTESRCLCR